MKCVLYIAAMMCGMIAPHSAAAANWENRDPYDPGIHKMAVQALNDARVYPITERVFPITATIRELKSENHDIAAHSNNVQAAANDIKNAMNDIGAKKTDLGYEINLNTDILFDFDKYNLKPQAQATLEKVAVVLHDKAISSISIGGHTDSKGNDRYNQTLSERRAKAVATWLKKHGKLNKALFRIAGYGKKKPLVPNQHPDGSDNPENRAKNRRVEIFAATSGQKTN